MAILEEREAAPVVVQRAVDERPAFEERVSRRLPIEQVVHAACQLAAFEE